MSRHPYKEETSFVYGEQSWGRFLHSRPLFDSSEMVQLGGGRFEIHMIGNNYIDESLRILGIDREKLSKMDVLNVGTGRESIYFQKLGARSVTHIDIASENVKRTQAFCQQHGIKNITSIATDIADHALPAQSYDLAFLMGVYQHFETPAKGLLNISNALRVGGNFYMGWYRSGEWRFFVNELSRKLMRKDLFRKVQRHVALNAGFGNNNHYQVARALDDFFVPAHHKFHPSQITHDTELLGLKVVHMDNDFRAYSHEVTPLKGEGYERDPRVLDPGQTGTLRLDYFSIGADRGYFQKVRHVDNVALSSMKTTVGIDQVEEIEYQTDIERENIKLFRILCQYCEFGYFSDEEIIAIAVSIYRMARPFAPDHDEYFNRALKIGRHNALNEYLKNVIASPRGP